jgi:hypothetical protein
MKFDACFSQQVAQAADASRRADATEKKVAVLTAGFTKRSTTLATQVSSLSLLPALPPPCLPSASSLLQSNGLADAAYDKRLLLQTYIQAKSPNSCFVDPSPHLSPHSCASQSNMCCPFACRNCRSVSQPCRRRRRSFKRVILRCLVQWPLSKHLLRQRLSWHSPLHVAWREKEARSGVKSTFIRSKSSFQKLAYKNEPSGPPRATFLIPQMCFGPCS